MISVMASKSGDIRWQGHMDLSLKINGRYATVYRMLRADGIVEVRHTDEGWETWIQEDIGIGMARERVGISPTKSEAQTLATKYVRVLMP